MNLLRRNLPAQNELYGFFFWGGVPFCFVWVLFLLAILKLVLTLIFWVVSVLLIFEERESSHFPSWVGSS